MMGMFDTILDRIGRRLASLLVKQAPGYQPYTPSDYDTLSGILEPGDVLLVEGDQIISGTIKYLTQSTWSHAAFYIGDALVGENDRDDINAPRLIEVTIGEGCSAVPLARYQRYNTRICRPYRLTEEDRRKIVEFMVSKIGLQYDTRNIFDLLRYFLPLPVPQRWRRRAIAFGSGDPTRAICSSLIAQAYQSIGYPILPEITLAPGRAHAESAHARKEILHIRHHALFAPRDFDLSPYFRVVKPTIEKGFDYRDLTWSEKVSEKDILRARTLARESETEAEISAKED